MEEQFYYRDRGQIKGPFTAEKLRNFARRGKFARHHEISNDGTHWIRADSHPDLFPIEPPPLRVPVVKPPGTVVETPKQELTTDILFDDRIFDEEQIKLEIDEPETTSPAEEIHEPVSSPSWFYTNGGQELGPVSREDLQRLAIEGSLEPTDYVWGEGMPDWVEAARVRGLCPANTGTHPVTTSEVKKTSSLATLSLVFGLLGATLLFFVGSIAAIITGHMALSEIRRDGGKTGGKGRAQTGLIFGYFILIAGILVGTVLLVKY